MSANKIQLTFVINELFFVAGGALLLVFALISEGDVAGAQDTASVIYNVLLAECPLGAAVANAILIFATFAIAMPGLLMSNNRGFLKLHGFLIVLCSIFTLVIGLYIWIETLTTRSKLSDIWNAQPASVQSIIQEELLCCGYYNSTSPIFVVDNFCTSTAVAAGTRGCVGPFSSFANNYLDIIFTSAFGIVGIDVLAILSTAMLLKDRKERERYRGIDEKNGMRGF